MKTLNKDHIERKLTKQYDESPELQAKFRSLYNFLKQAFCSRTEPITIHESVGKREEK